MRPMFAAVLTTPLTDAEASQDLPDRAPGRGSSRPAHAAPPPAVPAQRSPAQAEDHRRRAG